MPDRSVALTPGPSPLLLDSLRISPSRRILVLAPHPDDFDAIGVTLRHLLGNGNRIELAVLTSGANGVEDGFAGAITRDAKRALRESEQRASCRFFGLPDEQLTFLRLEEDGAGHLADSPGNLARVKALLAGGRPDLVFLPHGHDPNQAHRLTADLLRRSARDTGLATLACQCRDPKTIAMRADLIAAFDAEAAAWKGELLRHHRSQQERNLKLRGHGIDARILDLNRDSASALGLAAGYAEVFELEALGGVEPATLLSVSGA